MLRLLPAVVICFLVYPNVYSIDTVAFVKKQKRFIAELYKNKRYFDTIGEVRRLMMYDNVSAAHNEYPYFIQANYYHGKQFKSVILNYSHYDTLQARDIFLLSHAFYKNRMYHDSINVLSGLEYHTLAPGYAYDLLSYRSDILLGQGNYQAVMDEIRALRKLFPKNKMISDYESYMSEYGHLSYKSEGLAVVLSSVLPGSGQLYSGKYSDALISLLGVAGSALGAYHFYREKERGLSYTFGFFGVLFYTGNIYGAYNSAKDYNSQVDTDFSNRAREKYLTKYRPDSYYSERLKKIIEQ